MTIIEPPEGAPERFRPPMSTAAEPYWEATRQRQLVLQWCRPCDRAIFFPREACPSCLGADLEYRPASGAGTVHALSTMPKPANPTMAGHEPYIVALVELDEGVRMMTNLVGADADTLSVDDRVQVAWEPLTDGRHLPVFTRTS